MVKQISLKRLSKFNSTYICKICGTILPNEAYVAEIHVTHKHTKEDIGKSDWFDDYFRNLTLQDVIMIVDKGYKSKKQFNPKCNCWYCSKARSHYGDKFEVKK